MSQEDIPDLMPWGPKLVIGIDAIDDQHQKLVMFINNLHRAMTLRRGTGKTGEILIRLADYKEYHFDFEKSLFEKYGDLETREPLKINDRLVAKVKSYEKQYEEGRAAVSMDLMDFLTEWLRDHIMKTDTRYVPFLKEKMTSDSDVIHG